MNPIALQDEVEDMLSETSHFYFDVPLKIPLPTHGLDEVYNEIFKQNNIEVKVEDGYLVNPSNNWKVINLTLDMTTSGLFRMIIDRLFGSYAEYVNEFSIEHYKLTSTYVEIPQISDEEVDLIKTLFNADMIETTDHIHHQKILLNFKDSDNFSLQVIKNVKNYRLKEDGGGVWEITIPERKIESVSSLKDEDLKTFCNRAAKELGKHVLKWSEDLLEEVRVNELIIQNLISE